MHGRSGCWVGVVFVEEMRTVVISYGLGWSLAQPTGHTLSRRTNLLVLCAGRITVPEERCNREPLEVTINKGIGGINPRSTFTTHPNLYKNYTLNSLNVKFTLRILNNITPR